MNTTVGSQKIRLRDRILHFYEKNEGKLEVAFFLAGFLFDLVMLPELDEPIAIVQQIVYIAVMLGILCFDFIHGSDAELSSGPKWIRRLFAYRGLVFHFFLGTLLNIYSIFFFKSASFFNSLIFVVILLGLIIGNESRAFKKGGIDFKIAFHVIIVFCFFSMMFPVMLGRVGELPFLLALVATLSYVYLIYRILRGRVGTILIRRRLLIPGMGVAALFTIFYLVGWIPPVPLSTEKMGIYHGVGKAADHYQLLNQRPWWKVWQRGDQAFRARPGDKIYFFAAIFSPARFDDTVYVRWAQKNARTGWQSTDRIPMRVTGGRKGGYRGFTTKSNYSPGDWRVSVETSDGREIGRMYFTVTPEEAVGERTFEVESY